MWGPLIGGKDFQLPLDKEASSRRGIRRVPRRRGIFCFFGEKQKRNGGVRKRLILKYGRCCSWKRCVQTRA
jgi:hypothetical protein